MKSFDAFFRAATGCTPHGYQRRLARDGLPAVVQVPTGAGKTGVIVAWLWRRLRYPGSTPRRLVYALPQRSLVEQVAGEAGRWLENLGLGERVALHVAMGGEGKSQRRWRQDMHQPAIVVGTVDSLVSKALNRGYGIGRGIYPIDFALVTNGAHWVIDEIQLCPESTTTLRQLAAFAAMLGTAEPFGLTCMSATVPEGSPGTVGSPAPGDVLGILPEERTGELAVRLDAARTVRRLAIEPGDYEAIAAEAAERHRPGTLTLVVLNTVDAARGVYKALSGQPAPRLLLHSLFRGAERAPLMARLAGELGEAGRIVVATQVAEAGMDLDASVLITEAAPWPSVIRRAGRCNRAGRTGEAEFCWVRPGRPAPYQQADVDAASAGLTALEGSAVTSEELLRRDVGVTGTPVTVLRRSDLIALFDTTPDLDIAPYVRDAEDLDVQLAWATWSAGESADPPAEARAPAAEYRCRVPLHQLSEFVKRDGVIVWRMDQVHGRWTRVCPQARARPGEVLIAHAASGGYDPETGFEPGARGPVPGSPPLDEAIDLAAGAEDASRAGSSGVPQRGWISVDRHSQEVRGQAESLLSAIGPDLPGGAAQSIVTAAYVHDIGKAHPIFQDALCALAPAEREGDVAEGRPWAKSGIDRPLRFAGGVAFRHELASLLMLDGPLRELLAEARDPDLVRYLVLAHHGILRLQVRDPGDLAVLPPAEASENKLLGLAQDAQADVPPMLGMAAATLRVDLEQFGLRGESSWTRTALGLRDRYGPFVLAYLEAVVRMADWRASAGVEEAR